MKDLTKGNTYKAIISFAVPIAFGSLFQLFYSLVDTRIVGSTLGEDALAAVGATTTLNTLIVGFLIGLTNGFSVISAQFFGANNHDKLRKSVVASFVLGLAVSITLTAISLLGLGKILNWLNMPEEHFENGYKYIFVILAGMIVTMLYNACACALRAVGDAITPLVFLILSTVLNIFLDYYFILNLKAGVAGAAFATVISQFVAFVLCIIYMFKKYKFLRPVKEDFKIENNMASHMLISGMSMGFMQSLVSLGTVSLQSAINTFGTNTIVAHAAARKVTEIFMLPFGVLGMTMTTYCGQNLGAGKIERIKQGIKNAMIISWVWCILVIIASNTITPSLIRMITASNEAEIINTATLYLRVDTTLYFVTAVITVFRNSLQGIGDNVVPVISSAIELIGKFLVVVLLTPTFKYMAIIAAEPIVWVLMVIPLIIRMMTIPILKRKEA